MKLWYGTVLVYLLALAACDTSANSHAVYRTPVICTDMKPFEILGKPPDEQPAPSCVASNPGSEMYDREKGQVGIPEGVGILVTEVFYGVTGIQ